MLSSCLWDFSGIVGAFVIGLSQISSFSPTDRPKSVRNRCVIEVLVAFLCRHLAFWIFLWA